MASVTVATTATQIVASNPGRTDLLITNNDTVTIWIGLDNTVTVGNGYPFKPAREWTFTFNGDADAYPLFYKGAIWGIVAAATANVRVLEFYPPSEIP